MIIAKDNFDESMSLLVNLQKIYKSKFSLSKVVQLFNIFATEKILRCSSLEMRKQGKQLLKNFLYLKMYGKKPISHAIKKKVLAYNELDAKIINSIGKGV